MEPVTDRCAESPKQGQNPQLELDRKRLHLLVLRETAQELSGINQPRKLLETFLLTAMGPTGAVRGVAVLADANTCEGLVLSRGLPQAEAETLEQMLPEICDAYFPYRDNHFTASKIRTLKRSQTPGDPLLLSGMDLQLCFTISDTHCGLLALGPLLTDGEAGHDEDTDNLLHSLVHLFIGALGSTLAMNSIRQMTVDLSRKNERLSEALALSQASERGQRRRMHQLAALSELSGELSHRHQVQEILDSFLLTMLGAFSVKNGAVLLLDRAARRTEHSIRCAQQTDPMDFAAADALVYKAFVATGARSVAPLTVEPVANPQAALADCGLNFTVSCAVYFVLDTQVQGVLALGETLSGEPLAEEDALVARTQAATLLGYVQGARHLATITGLNQDLVQHNLELTRTISELTQARETIDILERARERVRSFLYNEGARSRRFSWLDCGVMLLASMLLGFLFNLASPAGVPLVPEHLRRPPTQSITVQKARELLQNEGALMVDARPQGFYEQRRISGAVNLTPGLFDMIYLMRFSQVPLSTPIIVYGGNISRRWDEDVAARLLAREHERVLVLQDGLSGWVARGYPVEP